MDERKPLVSPLQQLEDPHSSPAKSLKMRHLIKVENAFARGKDAVLELAGRTFDDTTTDDLTGLFNRRVFFKLLSKIVLPRMRRMREKGEGPIVFGSLAVVDIDHFKQINEMYGHAGGDEVLRVLGTKVMREFREDDVAGRTGGDELVIVAIGLLDDDVRERMEELRFDFENHPWELDRIDDGQKPPIRPTFQYGVIEIDDPEQIGQLLHKADRDVFDQKRDRRVRER